MLVDLHSNMKRLILCPGLLNERTWIEFTFQYEKINTNTGFQYYIDKYNLHSNMKRLILSV